MSQLYLIFSVFALIAAIDHMRNERAGIALAYGIGGGVSIGYRAHASMIGLTAMATLNVVVIAVVVGWFVRELRRGGPR